MVNWQQLIDERNAWIDHNFPGPDMPNSLLGVIEELGELTHHHLKQDQSIRGSDEHHITEAQDAVGDMTVYLLGVMNAGTEKLENLDLENPPPGDQRTAEGWLLDCASRVGELATDPHDPYPLEELVYCLKGYCMARGWDYDEIVQRTWDHVKQRDWILYPDTGMPPQHHDEHVADPIPDSDPITSEHEAL